MIHMEYYLIVSAIMFFAGIYGFFTRRNTLAILISIELILNATDINFAVYSTVSYSPEDWKDISSLYSPSPSRRPKRL